MKNIRIEKFRKEDRPDLYDSSLMIRETVFISEQYVDPTIEIEYEDESLHYLLLLDEKPVATARWRETARGIKLERFATLKDFRRTGLGEIILKAVIDDVLPFNKKIYLHSQARALDFYLRNGFVVTGNMFIEAGIEHYPMEYQ